MNIMRIGRNVTIIAFLLSLLFHGSTILYIFLQKTHKSLINETGQNQHNIAQQPLQQLPTNQQKPWVTTQARAGNFGSPVFFEDLPEEISENTSATSSAQDITKEENTTQEDIHDFSHEQELEEEATSAQQEESIKEIPTHQIAQNNNLFINTFTQQQSPAAHKKTTPRKKRTRPITKTTAPKPPITLAQLTQGFLDRGNNSSGSHGVSMIGMKTGKPSHEQLKYERYLQKLEWCFQNSLRINRDRIPPFSGNVTVYIALAINRDGTLKNLAVSQSSGNILLDKFVLFIFQDASSSFPPMPSYLPDDPFAITCIVPVSGPY